MWEQFKTSFLTPARVVPVVMLAVQAGVTAATAWLATKGWLNLDPAQTVAIVGPLAVGALATVFKWQDGYQKYETRSEQRAGVVETYDVHPDDLVPDVDDLDSEKAKAREASKLAPTAGTATSPISASTAQRHPKGRDK